MSVSSTLHQPLSLRLLNLHDSTRSANTLTTTGSLSRQLSTSSCTTPSPPSTAASQAPLTSHCVCSLLVDKSRTKTTSKRLHTSISRRRSQSTRRLLAIREHSSRRFVLSRVRCIQHGTLAKRTTTHSSQNARYTAASCSRSPISAVQYTLQVTCGGRQSSDKVKRRILRM